MRELTAYFLTLRSYGTWLHGDARGSVDKENNSYKEPLIEPRRSYENAMRRAMNSEAFRFNRAQRGWIEAAIEEVARYRDWPLGGLAIRTNHVHIVVGADASPEKVVVDFKAYATRNLRRNGLPRSQNVWAEHGSTLYLFDTESYEAAINYVLEQQGESLSDVD
ncbi:MAG TPA: transposase [Abditibacterium sp.]|jgi:REP element-mobilizing transposase RayT